MPVKRLGAPAEPDFRNLYFARAFSLIGDGIVPVALAFGVLQTDSSATALGTVLAARSRTLVTFLLIGGVIADRLPRRSLMIGSDVLRLIAQAATAAILISRTAKVWEIAALAVVYGFGNAFFLPTSTGIIPQTVSPERLALIFHGVWARQRPSRVSARRCRRPRANAAGRGQRTDHRWPHAEPVTSRQAG
jgi:MFS family permease